MGRAIKTIILIATFFVVIAMALAECGSGSEKMDLEGGKRGKVPFSHHLHQEILDDCNICHSIFPQESGAIESLKRKGKLESKQVMNRSCIRCHRVYRLAGKPHGPITCSKCHTK